MRILQLRAVVVQEADGVVLRFGGRRKLCRIVRISGSGNDGWTPTAERVGIVLVLGLGWCHAIVCRSLAFLHLAVLQLRAIVVQEADGVMDRLRFVLYYRYHAGIIAVAA